MKNIIALILLISFAYSYNDPFNIEIEPMNIDGFDGLQSFAFAQHDNKLIMFGGRLDGLHRRQPWASFDIDGHNDQLLVLDLINSQVWRKDLNSLSTDLQEQLSSTNMNFYQEDDQLYIVGGYGYSESEGDHTTYPYLTSINVSGLIDAVINNSDITPFFRQISDSQFQVTGGKLKKINDVYHLLGGQKFIGRYNPMGPDHGPGFIQEYTNQIRRFTINDDGNDLSVSFLEPFTDEENLHRRDYNAEVQVLPNGEQAITMFSGVFQKDADLPFLSAVTVDQNGYKLEEDFSQYYNHYHCAVATIYSKSKKEMHTLFFGGIAQYYDAEGTLVQDDDVPFVKTIARITRDSDGQMTEYKLPIEMPEYLGAGSEFIIDKNIQKLNNEIIDLDNISDEKVLIGHIIGGINSSDKNIFFINDGTQSTASNRLFKVYLTKSTLSTHSKNQQSNSSLKMQVFPNPNSGVLTVDYYLNKIDSVMIKVTDLMGHTLVENTIKDQKIGKNTFSKNIQGLSSGTVLFVSVRSGSETISQKIIIN